MSFGEARLCRGWVRPAPPRWARSRPLGWRARPRLNRRRTRPGLSHSRGGGVGIVGVIIIMLVILWLVHVI